MRAAARVERSNLQRWRHRFEAAGAPPWMAREIVADLIWKHRWADVPRAVTALIEHAEIHGFRTEARS